MRFSQFNGIKLLKISIYDSTTSLNNERTKLETKERDLKEQSKEQSKGKDEEGNEEDGDDDQEPKFCPKDTLSVALCCIARNAAGQDCKHKGCLEYPETEEEYLNLPKKRQEQFKEEQKILEELIREKEEEEQEKKDKETGMFEIERTNTGKEEGTKNKTIGGKLKEMLKKTPKNRNLKNAIAAFESGVDYKGFLTTKEKQKLGIK